MASIASNGYRIVYVGKNHHLADCRGYAYEHRVVIEAKIGRKLKKGEQVHHIDHNKLNNHPSNLEVTKSRKYHLFLHRKSQSKLKLPDEDNTLVECACGCGGTFYKYDNHNRPRTFLPSHNMNIKEGQLFKKILTEIECGKQTINDLISIIGGSRSAIRIALYRMAKLKLITRIKIGVYAVKGTPKIKKQKNYHINCKCGCGKRLMKFDEYMRKRDYISGHNNRKRWEQKQQ